MEIWIFNYMYISPFYLCILKQSSDLTSDFKINYLAYHVHKMYMYWAISLNEEKKLSVWKKEGIFYRITLDL